MGRVLLVFASLVPLLAACGDDDSGDIDAFCDRIGTLVDDDPFQRLPDTATPADMRRAFRSLRQHATAIAAAAPGELRPVAREWARAVREVDDLLAGSGYDAPTDQLAYEQQADTYESLRVRLENAAAQECPGITDR